MKIEFDLPISDVEEAIISHLAMESGVTITELLKRASAVYLSQKVMERRKQAAEILATGSKIDEQIISTSLEMAESQTSRW